MQTVGVRDLKARLSHHLDRVRAGQRLVVTDHGRPVASLQPLEESAATDWIRPLVSSGRASWS